MEVNTKFTKRIFCAVYAHVFLERTPCTARGSSICALFGERVG